MRKTLLFTITIGAAMLSAAVGYSYNCTWLCAAGGTDWQITLQDTNTPPSWVEMERTCNYCDARDTRTDCVGAGVLSPTWAFFDWDPSTGQWVPAPGQSGGSCQQKATANCP
jgi:hypothetical protein